MALTFNHMRVRAPRAASAALALGALALTDCASPGGGYSPDTAPREPAPISGMIPPSGAAGPEHAPIPRGEPATPANLRGREDLVRAALLLPFSSPSERVRAEAASMLDAAQLALFETAADSLILIPKDTGGTPEGAQAVARDALSEGADVILGPFFSAAVPLVAQEAARADVPVISFSNDRAAAATGAYLIDIPLEQEVERVLTFAATELAARRLEEDQEATQEIYGGLAPQSPYTPLPTDAMRPVSFAVIAPNNPYGQRVRDAVERHAPMVGCYLTTWEFFPPSAEVELLTPIARRLARFDERRAFEQARADVVVSEGEPEELFELPYDAVVLPEG
ncbi:MAG: ABC transporter substrate-binding protein, partial [Caulobacterales bacterium]|nr:ABC transporter substrate-binding protein [Caulobacterales bacterium]